MLAIKSAYKNILLCMRQVNKPGMDKKQEHRAEHTELGTEHPAARKPLDGVCEQWGRIQRRS